MRRATAALLGTVAGTVLLVGAKYGTAPANGAGVDNAAEPLGPAPGIPSAAGPSATGPDAPSTASTAQPPGAGSAASPSRRAGGGNAGPAPVHSSAAPGCTTTTGGPVDVARPGIGAVTVTIKVCGGAISTASGSLSQSDWNRNTAAVPALDSMAVQYYKTGFSQIHYSGATLTSNAYRASLRSAMNAARI